MNAGSWPYDVLDSLAVSRPVFHSEADFQHAFAWQSQLIDPNVRVRLEVRPDPNIREALDLFCVRDGSRIAIEFKYVVRKLAAVVRGEPFRLRDQGAQPLSRYDIIKDIARLERFCESGFADVGYAIVLSNDPLIWSPGRPGLIDEAFRVHEGAILSGTLAWASHAKPGTTKGREMPIALRGSYVCHWHSFPASNATEITTPFRFMIAAVQPREGRADMASTG